MDVKAVYSFTAFENGVRRGYYEVTITNVEDGKDGIPGASYYTWLKYADDEKGNGMSDSPDGKQYMGIAYNKESPDESLKPADYQWSRITGEGIPGKPGADGKTYTTWYGTLMTRMGPACRIIQVENITSDLRLIKRRKPRVATQKTTSRSKYRGDDGIPGTEGEDGRTSYFHVKYSAVANPSSSSQMTETPSKYIGTYVDYTQQDSNNPKDYTWSQFRGDPGEINPWRERRGWTHVLLAHCLRKQYGRMDRFLNYSQCGQAVHGAICRFYRERQYKSGHVQVDKSKRGKRTGWNRRAGRCWD